MARNTTRTAICDAFNTSFQTNGHSGRGAILRRVTARPSRFLFKLLYPVEQFFRRRCNSSARFSALYYVLFSDRFHREQWAFQRGQQTYFQQRNSPQSGFALLRRNTHRLEKGLLMRPRRNIFAVDYIEETVESFERVLHSRGVGPIEAASELRWVTDVLKQYFDTTKSHPKIDAARRRFLALSFSVNGCDHEHTPYRRDLSVDPSVSIDDLMTLARRRRSVRWFLDKPVPRKLIDRAMEVAAQSPSACNRQPFVFHILDDPSLVREAAQIPMGTAGYAENIPVFVVIVGQQRNYFDERDRHLIYIDSSLAAMAFIFALEVQGLSTCCINWPDIEDRERKMAKFLSLEADERPVMCLAIGYPDPEGLVAYSQKKPLSQIRRYNIE